MSGTTCRLRVKLTTEPSVSMQKPSRSPVAIAAHHLLLPTYIPCISGSRKLVSNTALDTHPSEVQPPSTTQSISPASWARPPNANSATGAIMSPCFHMPS